MYSRILFFICICFIAADPADASSPKEIKAALEEKYQITKRKLFGGIKEPGTVLYINIPGIVVEPPKFRMTPVNIKDGELDASSSVEGEDRVAIPVGEPMHIYSIRTNENSVMLQLGTESTLPKTVMGSEDETHFQAALVFTFDEGLSNLTVEDVVATISGVALTEEEAARHPDLVAAAASVRESNAAALAERSRPREQAEERKREERMASSTARESTASRAPTSSEEAPPSLADSTEVNKSDQGAGTTAIEQSLEEAGRKNASSLWSTSSGEMNSAAKAVYRQVERISTQCPASETIRIFRDGSSAYDPDALYEVKNFGFVLDDIELTAADTANGITYKGWMLFNEDMIWRRKVRHYWGAWKQMDNGNPNVSSGHMLIVKDEVLSYDPEGSVGDRYERLFVKRMLLKEELEEPSQDVCSI